MKTCENCFHYGACLLNGEYLPSPCRKYTDKTDVVEVVRCKDCCWCMVTSQPYAAAYCIKGTRSFIVEADDFCSRGERKEG